MNKWLKIALTGLLIWTVYTTATAQENPEVPETSSETQPETSPEAAQDETATRPEPEAENLRRGELSEAFRNFQPSEEISADNAVPFPVDI